MACRKFNHERPSLRRNTPLRRPSPHPKTQPEGELKSSNYACFHCSSGTIAAQLPQRFWLLERVCAGLVHHAANLPVLEAALTRVFRFVSTVTILQQTISPIIVVYATYGLP
jgi:hypothetical protein